MVIMLRGVIVLLAACIFIEISQREEFAIDFECACVIGDAS